MDLRTLLGWERAVAAGGAMEAAAVDVMDGSSCRDMTCPRCWCGQARRWGLAGLQLGLPQQPGLFGQDSPSPAGIFSHPGAAGALLAGQALVLAITAVVMGGKRGLGGARDLPPLRWFCSGGQLGAARGEEVVLVN